MRRVDKYEYQALFSFSQGSNDWERKSGLAKGLGRGEWMDAMYCSKIPHLVSQKTPAEDLLGATDLYETTQTNKQTNKQKINKQTLSSQHNELALGREHAEKGSFHTTGN